MCSNLKISVIIPVYNVSKYLHQCVNSVLTQDYKNLEVILVDDGSTDESPKICDNYVSEYPDIIKVIHKSNGGLSDARNAGIHESSGDYVAFLDGDDFWNTEIPLSSLADRVSQTNADVLNFSYAKYYEDIDKTESYFPQMSSMPTSAKCKDEQLKFIFDNNYYIASACNKFIKRDLLDDELFFEFGAYSEDVEWCLKLLLKAKSFDFIALDFYYYRQRANSISHTINDKKCNDLCKHIIECIKLSQNSSTDIKKYLYNYSAYQFGTFFIVQALAENKQKDCIDKLKSYTYILSHNNGNKKLVVLNILCKLLGYKITCKMIRLVYSKKRQ